MNTAVLKSRGGQANRREAGDKCDRAVRGTAPEAFESGEMGAADFVEGGIREDHHGL